MLRYAIVLAVAAGVTYAMTPLVRRFGVRVGAVVYPDERRVHTAPLPTIGGTAMFVAFLVAMGVASVLPGFKPVFTGSSEPFGVIIAAAIIFGVGFLDDLREVSAPAKVAGQVLAACALGLAGVTMFYFRIPFADFVVLSPDLGFLVTVLWVVVMANAVNLIDGLDGLAAGVVAIAAGASSSTPTACPTPVCSPPTTSGRSSPSSRAACAWGSCPTTSIRRRSSWATPAPSSSAC